MAYLLDTNAVSNLIREPAGVVATRIRDAGTMLVCTSSIVSSEIRYGAIRRGSPRLSDRVEDVLTKLRVLPFAPPADQIYGAIRTRLERAGTPIGQMDFLIAAHAIALDYVLVTDNEREFRRIADLKVENWSREP